jgi:hypothetical protein
MREEMFSEEEREGVELPDPAAWVACPYCGEEIEVLIDVGGGSVQEYIEDCEICCQPCSVRVVLGDEQAFVSLETLDEA